MTTNLASEGKLLSITSTLPLLLTPYNSPSKSSSTHSTPGEILPRQQPSSSIPILGLGVYRIKSAGGACLSACQAALEAGYWHIDTARLYRNEPDVRDAVEKFTVVGGISDSRSSTALSCREAVFLTTKIRESTGDVERDYRAAVKCVERLAGAEQSAFLPGKPAVPLESYDKTNVPISHAGTRVEDGDKDSEEDKEQNDTRRERQQPRETKRRKTMPTANTDPSQSNPVIPPPPLPYVDLFLIHQPMPTFEQRRSLWQALERLHREGRARNIGVSNYRIEHIEEMREYAEIWPPCVNQIEVHPWFQQIDLTKYCASHGIVVEAFAPLAQGRHFHTHRKNKTTPKTKITIGKPLDNANRVIEDQQDWSDVVIQDNILLKMADKHSKTPAQVLIRWSLQKGFVALPKSARPERIHENADVFDFELDDEDMVALDGLDDGIGTAGVTYKWNKA